MDRGKVLRWFPGSANFGEVKGHCILDNDASSASIDREGPGALWEGHQVALTASHGCVVFAWAANHLRKECTQVRGVRQAESSRERTQQAPTHQG